MGLLADECVAGPIVRALRTRFSDVVFVAESAPGMPDDDVLAWATRELTADYDFGELAYRKKQPAFAIIIIAEGVFRGDDETSADRIVERIIALEGSLEGHLTIIESKRTRQRAL